ncbi:MAG: type I-C CRISPR-associated protein Cas8c/Csd1 [Tissierellia bacterium]|nr:type I-C CRISPR-associated protein Cas8c/Csd1 [Tissierellia bacterium]
MALANALLKSYETCELNGLVDKHNNPTEVVLLPIYHSNIRTDGKNVFEIVLDKQGKLLTGAFLQEGEYCIFPVTEDSVSRSSGAVARPLVDELQYLDPSIDDPKRQGLYEQELKNWLNYQNSGDVNRFLGLIYDLVTKASIRNIVIQLLTKGLAHNYDNKSQILEIITQSNGKTTKEKIGLSKILITFRIKEFDDGKDCSVTDYVPLHESYIEYQQHLQGAKEQSVCNLTGEKTYCSAKHRGMMGNARIIAGGTDDKNLETYFGRFTSRAQVINISYEASSKLHNMIKYLLENRNNSTRMSFKKGVSGADPAVLSIWFSDDVSNDRETSIIQTAALSPLDYDPNEDTVFTINGSDTKNLLLSAIGFNRKIDPNAKVYVMILDKVSNGRISIKYFFELSQNDFYSNLEHWYRTFNWFFYERSTRQFTRQSPDLFRLFDLLYGIEYTSDDGRARTQIPDSKNKYKETLMTRVIPCIIDRKRIPIGMVKRANDNIRMRQKYSKTWESVMSISCAVLNKHRIDTNKVRMEDTLIAFDQQTRSYLYGRVLAVLEYLEKNAMGDSTSVRITNAERFWNNYTASPARTLHLLQNRLQPYIKKLKKDPKQFGNTISKQNIIQDCVNRIAEIENANDINNKPVNEEFIFGYYAQRKQLYTKKTQEQQTVDQSTAI